MKMLLAVLGYIDKSHISKLLSQEILYVKRSYKDLGVTKGLPKKAHPGGPCVPGAMRPMIDVDGFVYPCERVSEISEHFRIGHIDYGFDLDKANALLNIGKISESECMNCWNFIRCGLCAVAADATEGLSKEKKMKHCADAKKHTLDTFETICFLKEHSYDFEEN